MPREGREVGAPSAFGLRTLSPLGESESGWDGRDLRLGGSPGARRSALPVLADEQRKGIVGDEDPSQPPAMTAFVTLGLLSRRELDPRCWWSSYALYRAKRSGKQFPVVVRMVVPGAEGLMAVVAQDWITRVSDETEGLEIGPSARRKKVAPQLS